MALQPVSGDQGHLWAAADGPLGRGFCLTLVRGRKPVQVVRTVGGKAHEMVYWRQLVGPGDGEAAGRRYFVGMARLSHWTLILQDGDFDGGLGMDPAIAGRLAAGTDVVVCRCDRAGRGRVRTYRDGVVGTDVTDHTEEAIRLVEKRAGIRLTGALLEQKRYLLVTVPKA
ncbi:hypothetical protein ACWT_0017 [Actinoplanes sp. SE50]|uniref:DUF6461 domain-containing protein n=1 Tax=unclassified Actinoplanes TaxID=2626549 RepID=UPI00023ECDBE|nr:MULTISPECIES: DUF6461 domain-containing protein [unclassified Actinoplanes]AEV81031.1 hypothetical protein ACPL_132 [Actinoplanes sp. SE50/110]ATO79432.1 hypothetical protein ACWT_0017 [Actinoplanes sp. SE50]SLL96832.1 hypothetical protein ACSP50_0019 [Actinoplanes sp. SE50/110]